MTDIITKILRDLGFPNMGDIRKKRPCPIETGIEAGIAEAMETPFAKHLMGSTTPQQVEDMIDNICDCRYMTSYESGVFTVHIGRPKKKPCIYPK